MTSACNWVNRVKRVETPIISDGAFITDRVESRDTGRVLPITGHRMHNHFYIAEYERATYVWDENGASKRIPRSA